MPTPSDSIVSVPVQTSKQSDSDLSVENTGRSHRALTELAAPVDAARILDPPNLVEQAMSLPKSESPRIRRLLESALDLDPRNVPALREMAGLNLEQEKYDDAIVAAKRCLAEAPEDRDCTDIRNMAKGRSGRLDVTEMEQCYQARPNDFTCVQGLLQARIKQRRLDEATHLVDEARRLRPESALVTAMEGDIARLQGDQPKAAQKYQGACSEGQEYACKMVWQLQPHDR